MGPAACDNPTCAGPLAASRSEASVPVASSAQQHGSDDGSSSSWGPQPAAAPTCAGPLAASRSEASVPAVRRATVWSGPLVASRSEVHETANRHTTLLAMRRVGRWVATVVHCMAAGTGNGADASQPGHAGGIGGVIYAFRGVLFCACPRRFETADFTVSIRAPRLDHHC